MNRSVTGNQPSANRNNPSSVAAAAAGRSERTAAAAPRTDSKVTPSSVSRKIEPSASRSASAKSETSSLAVTGKDIQSIRVKDSTGTGASQRVSPRSVSVKLDAPKEQRNRNSSASTDTPNSRAAASSEKLITANTEPARATAVDGASNRGSQDRLARSTAAPSSTRENTPADSSLRQGLNREAQPAISPERIEAGSREGLTNRAASGQADLTRSPRSGTEGAAPRDRQDREPRIVVNNTNNVIVEGNVNEQNVRPQVPRQLTNDVDSLQNDSHWNKYDGHHDGRRDDHHGSSTFYFSFAWSNLSCGRVAYLPYDYYHSWCSYPTGYYGLSYYYPDYHRRFIFVSLGGYWPSSYRYHRYYWYGCHPYYWYGPDIVDYPSSVVYPSEGPTYNTYNYYYNDPPVTETSTPYYDLGGPKQTQPEQQPVDEPEYQTAADLCFEHAVELFTSGNYEDAAAQLREAIVLSPEDVVLPFTYVQALFANGDYAMAASVLRSAVAKIPDDELTIYYPRGLYQDEMVLKEQVAKLQLSIAAEPFSADYQLLLGYQYMGLGDLNKARKPLLEAAQNDVNKPTVDKLMDLAAKLEQEAAEQ